MFTADAAPPNLAVVGFGQEVRRRRRASELTLEQLAERCGLTPNYIGTIENGQRDPSLSSVLALAKGLRVHAADLLGGTRSFAPAAVEAARLFESIPEESQEPLLGLLRVLAKRRR